MTKATKEERAILAMDPKEEESMIAGWRRGSSSGHQTWWLEQQAANSRLEQ